MKKGRRPLFFRASFDAVSLPLPPPQTTASRKTQPTDNVPIGSRQFCAFSFSEMRGLIPPSHAIGLVDIDSTPPASPTE